MKSRGFDVNEKLVRSQSLHEISGEIYKDLDYYHDIRGIQEICERKDMKRCVSKYLDSITEANSRGKRKGARISPFK
jgi:hypothetical protein